ILTLPAHSDAHQTELSDSPMAFLHSSIDILKRNQPDGFETWALRANTRHPVIVAPAECCRIIFLRQLGYAEPSGWKKNRDVDLFLVHVPKACRYVGDVHTELAVHARVPNLGRQ